MIAATLSLVGAALGDAPDPEFLGLWYREPARWADPHNRQWENAPGWLEALPVGNGRLGAMVFGGTERERLQLNEDSLWSGNPYDADNPAALEALPEVRRLLLAGQVREAQALASKTLVCKGPGSGRGNGTDVAFGSYQSLGDLTIDFVGHGKAKAYRRELDLRRGVVTIRYQVGDTQIRREVFASHPDRAIVVRIVAEGPKRLELRARLTRIERAQTDGRADHLAMDGRLAGEPGMRFAARLGVRTDGKRTVVGDELHVDGATEATFLLTAATDFRGDDPVARADRELERGLKREPARLLSAHVTDYRRLFNRTDLRMPGRLDRRPTNQLLEAASKNEDLAALARLYWHFGRYLLISSARPGDLPPNLQGIWADGVQVPWSGDYHVNINLQMNHWGAESANLPETVDPLIAFVETLVKPGSKTARVHYGADGWVVHWATNVWGFTSPGEDVHWGQFPMAGAWLCRHLWDRYAYSHDVGVLRRIYPTLKASAEFYLDFLQEDPKTGHLVTVPTSSPENSFRMPDGQEGQMTYGPTMDNALLRELFANVARAADLLKTDPEFAATVRATAKRLPPYKVGRFGQLQEWIEDWDEPEPGHRHMSHLYGLYPGHEIDRFDTPEWSAAARKSIARRLANGGGHTGWSRAWLINFLARLGDSEGALFHFGELMRKGTYRNLFCAHPPFQIDGNFGGAAGVGEMLLQSRPGEVRLLPALPESWPDGEFRGWRTHGGHLVSCRWKGGRLVEATIRGGSSETLRVRVLGGAPKEVRVRRGETVALD